MSAPSKLRTWANRDDGRFYRIGNGPIGALTAIGTLALIGAVILRQVHSQTGFSSVWSTAVGVIGIVMLLLGLRHHRGT